MRLDKYTIITKPKNTWLISYGDLITLLITFFIMMIAVESGRSSLVHKWVDNQLAKTTSELNKSLSVFGVEGVEVNHDTKGVHITILSNGMFKEGEAEPSQMLTRKLDDISKGIKNLEILTIDKNPNYISDFKYFENRDLEWNLKIVVEGHTDNIQMVKGAKFGNNWELSAARAQTVMRLLQENLDLPPKFFAIKGYSEFKPLGDNNSVANRLKNRRVDIIINASFLKNGSDNKNPV